MQIFCSKNEKLDKNSENKEASEELYEEWEEVSVYEWVFYLFANLETWAHTI